MKNLFKIHLVTYLVIISVLLCGYFNYFLIISLILLVHDLGHLTLIKWFNYQIDSIVLLPFGSIINANINANTKTMHIFLIALAGVLMQSLLYLVMPLCLKLGFISALSYQIFLKYNYLLIIFNLLPIIPLDGAKIILCFLESIFSYKKALQILSLISVLSLLIFFIYTAYHALNSYLIFTFLLFKTYEAIKHHAYLFHHFLITRHLNSNHRNHVKYIATLKNIYKNKYNFINGQNEEKVLRAYFN